MTAHRVALVTGASRGIGRAIAQALASAGCAVALVARDEDALRGAAAGIQAATGAAVTTVAADLSDPAGIAAAVSHIRALGRLDVLINNAGATRQGTLLQVADADWDNGFALKFMAPVRLTRALWPMLAASHGSVLNIAGIAGRTPTADFVVGGAVNAAVLALTKSLAEMGAADGVRVNAINPGLISTGRMRPRIAAIMRRDAVDEATAMVTLAREWGATRIGTPEEVAALAVFLTVGGGTYCQGGLYDIDGGATRTM